MRETYGWVFVGDLKLCVEVGRELTVVCVEGCDLQLCVCGEGELTAGWKTLMACTAALPVCL